jgi:serine/threonine protein phosphatase PrpC
MQFQPVDSLSLPGDSDKPNEDALVHRTGVAAVFDGATPLSENLLPGPSDAQWVARFGANRLASHASGAGTPREWLRAAAGDAAKSFAALRKRAPQEQYENPFASMIAAFLTEGQRLTALWFGDCALIVRQESGAVRLIGDTLNRRDAERERVRRIASMARRGPAAAGVRTEFLPVLRAARDRVNSARGAWLFGPDPECADHVLSQELDIAAGDLLMLATDGFLTLISDYDRYDAESLIGAATERGLKALGEELRAIEAGDPEGNSFPRFKKSDDATALLLRVSE